ncbi:PREDICTED: uncharacterized protein LOC105556544, partial [Vollenhovia emeryi]|uniref:uncharacterized protein LOC105556544 n=1 Tax=Vollenhovia emeryi TaxID=411798 RepID=UPI0005F47F66
YSSRPYEPTVQSHTFANTNFVFYYRRINTLLQSILKCVQDNRGVQRKPAILPISSLAEMDDFENIDDNGFTEVVNYFNYIGGFNLKEAINLCLKEALKDLLTPSFTWWGREGGQRPLYNARIIIAIYGMIFFLSLLTIPYCFNHVLCINCTALHYILFVESMCNNKHFPKPTRSEFQAQAKEALRAAKERARSKVRGPRQRVPNPRDRNFWNDEQEPEQEQDENRDNGNNVK